MPKQFARLKTASGLRARSLVRARSGRADRAELEMRALQGFRTAFGAARTLDVQVRRIAKLSSSQLWALSEIADQPAVTVNGLAERMALHQTTASNLVNLLVERKFIRRARDADDQRIVHLHVTAEGRRVLQRVPPPHSGILVDALKRMPSDQLGVLGAALGGLVGQIRSAAPTASGESLMGE